MNLLLIGINHKSASIALREKLVFSEQAQTKALVDIVRRCEVSEALIISTCNRVEICCHGSNEKGVLEWLADYHQVDLSLIQEHSYCYRDEQAVAHLIRVVSGLDSMVLGEPQIMGQVKAAYRLADELGSLGTYLRAVMQQVFSACKRIRRETLLGSHALSLGAITVSLARRTFATFENKQLLLVGAGEIIELIAKHFSAAGISDLVVLSRSLENAELLARQYGGRGAPITELTNCLHQADIVVTATTCPLPIIGYGNVSAVMAERQESLFIVDLAVPRDVEPGISQIDNVSLYNMDDLQDIIDTSLNERQLSAAEAEKIVAAELALFIKWRQSLNAVESIRGFRDKMYAVQEGELAKALRQLEKGASPELILANFARGLTNKLIHVPTVQLRKAASDGRLDLLSVAQEIFDIDEDSA